MAPQNGNKAIIQRRFVVKVCAILLLCLFSIASSPAAFPEHEISRVDAAAPAGNIDNLSAPPKIGDKTADGTIYAGISPDTHKADAPRTMSFNDAQKYAAKLNAHGHQDWRVPAKAELNVLFNNRAAIGGLNLTGASSAGWYWSGEPDYGWGAWRQRFSDGAQGNIHPKYPHLSVRPVR